MNRPSAMRCLAIGLLAALLGAGCLGRTPTAKYYMLSPIENGESLLSTAAEDKLAVGIGPVKFPDELDRHAIVTRPSPTRLEVNEFQRWGGSLEQNVLRVLEENLAKLLQTDKVVSRPWESHFQPDVRIALDIRRFDGRLGEYASLNAIWTLIAPETEEPLLVRRTIIQESVAGESYDSLVEAQSRALGRLCREIADAVMDKYPAR